MNSPSRLTTHGMYLFVDNAYFDELLTQFDKQTVTCCSLIKQVLGVSSNMRSFVDVNSGITIVAVRDEFLRYTSVNGELRPVYPLVHPSMYHIVPLGVDNLPNFNDMEGLLGSKCYNTIVLDNALFPILMYLGHSDITRTEGAYFHMKAGGATLLLSQYGVHYMLGKSRSTEADFATFAGSVDFNGVKINPFPVLTV
jgi:hypothetical protein